MNLDIETLIMVYKDELRRLQEENIILKCKLIQMEKDIAKKAKEDEEAN